jgi:uncharacterized protein
MADLFNSQSRSARLDRVLSQLLGRAPELHAAAVVSFDGLPMASALPAEMDEDRVAAMSAALLSLGERASESFGRGSLSQVYVEGDSGTVFLVSADDEAVLVAVGASGAKVGLLMYEVRHAAANVAEALRADDAAAAEIEVQVAFESRYESPVESEPWFADEVVSAVDEPPFEAVPASAPFGERVEDTAWAAAPFTAPAPALHVVEPFDETDPQGDAEPADEGWDPIAEAEPADEATADEFDDADPLEAIASLDPDEAYADGGHAGGLHEASESSDAPVTGPWGNPPPAGTGTEQTASRRTPERSTNWTVYSPSPTDSYWT